MTLQYVIEALVCIIVEFIRSIERQSFIANISAAWLMNKKNISVMRYMNFDDIEVEIIMLSGD
jgi:hypothetical protein